MTSDNRFTVTFGEGDAEWIREQVESGEYSSQAECVRDVFRTGRRQVPALRERVHQLQEQLENREERIDDLEDQLRKRSNIESDIEQVIDEVEDLPAKIKDTESYSEKRQRAIDQAGILTRAKWRITGVPTKEIERE